MKVNILAPITIINPMSKATASSDGVQPDLLYFRSVLVSTGKNKNDDVFLPDETWAAKDTPVLKPVDWEHETGREIESDNPKIVIDGNQIIGTIYDCFVADKNGNKIDMDVAKASQVPEEFDIIIDSVVYKYLYPKTAARIAEEASQGKLFVSMEAWFKSYDYLLGSKVVARNEETSFLDKHLKARGGDGIFVGEPVGRILRSIVFGGVGFVRKPANDESVIHSITNATVDTSNIKEVAKVMADAPSNAPAPDRVSSEDYKSIVQKLVKAEHDIEVKDKELKTTLEKLGELEKNFANLKGSFVKGTDSLKGILGDSALKLSDTADWFSSLSEIIAEKLKVSESIKKELDTVKAEMEKAAAEKRIAEISAKLDLEFGLASSDKDSQEVAALKKGKKDKMMVKCSKMSNEEFASWLTETKELVALATPTPAPVAPTPAPAAPAPAPAAASNEASILESVTVTETVPAGSAKASVVESNDFAKAMAELVSELFVNSKEEK